LIESKVFAVQVAPSLRPQSSAGQRNCHAGEKVTPDLSDSLDDCGTRPNVFDRLHGSNGIYYRDLHKVVLMAPQWRRWNGSEYSLEPAAVVRNVGVFTLTLDRRVRGHRQSYNYINLMRLLFLCDAPTARRFQRDG